MGVLGIDIGGSGIKGAIVDTETGELATDRFRLPTPEGARPQEVAQVFAEVVKHFEYQGPIGVGFPAVIRGGIIYTAANISRMWIGTNASKLFGDVSGCPVYIVNDADAAGIAEMTFGIGRHYGQSVVFLITIGTGVGTAIFVNGTLLPNTELGHIEIRGKDAEKRASDAARQEKGYSWKQWAEKLQEYLSTIERLISPDVVIIGGGISKDSEKFVPLLNLKAKIEIAQLLNQAGIVGAALYAKNRS